MSNTISTLYGIADYSWLTEADTKFNPKGIYHVDLKVSKENAEPEIKTINDTISRKIAEIYKAKPGTKEIKRAPVPYEKQEDGTYIFKIKSQFQPKLWDRNQKELGADVAVWKGSTLWVQFKLGSYDQNIGVGCTLYLQSVQIDNLVQGSSQNGACPFPKREGVTA